MESLNSEEMKRKIYDFEDKLKAQQCAAKNEWEGLKIFYKREGREKKLVKQNFDLNGNTVIHALARSSAVSNDLLKEFLEMVPANMKGKVLTIPNNEGNTILHETVFRDKEEDLEKVRLIIEFARRYHQGGPANLLLLKNYKIETPSFRAAKYGNLKWLQYIHTKYCYLQQKDHFPPSVIVDNKGRERFRPILHCCAFRFHFDVAVWLLRNVSEDLKSETTGITMKGGEGSSSTKKEKGDDLKLETTGITMKGDEGSSSTKIEKGDEEEYTFFQLLSQMPMAFRSTDTQEMGIAEKLLYKLLPGKGYESELEWYDDAGNNLIKSKTDIENLQAHAHSTCLCLKYYAVWKFLAKKVPCIEEVWDRKKRHFFAKGLVEFIVEKMNTKTSWKEYSYTKYTEELRLMPDFPSNVTEKKKHMELSDRVNQKAKLKRKIRMEQSETNYEEDTDHNIKWETPLFLAAACGIIEVVKIIVERYPEAISHVNDYGLNILHMAIKHRQKEIYEYLEESSAFKSLTSRISSDGCTILHRAASMEYYRELPLPGVAYQLKHELQWYHRVSLEVPKQFLMHCDRENNLTAGDLLDIQHADMHDEAKVWIKETAQSCSTVAVLIASVVFAAAYALPGGTENGKPVLRDSPVFKFFTVMDVLALTGSLGSVVMFLSILTSPFDLWDFHVTLPRKLKQGLTMLALSIITTMLAFMSTIVLTIRMEGNKKTTTFIYSSAFALVALIALTQLPLHAFYLELDDQRKTFMKCVKRVFRKEPSDLLD